MAQRTPSRTIPIEWRKPLLTLAEWGIILLIGLLYSAALFSDNDLNMRGLDPALRIQGIEHERLSGILIPIQLGLGLSERAPGIGHLPAWNPYLGTGTPLLNNAFLYLYNPFMSLPVLLLGAVQGTKIAIIIGLLLAGLNMWALARAIGLKLVARVTAGALYLVSGGIMARLYSGHFQLGLSLVWLPLVLAGLWWTLHTADRRAPVLMALAFALLFFAGNIYYTLHALVCCAVIAMCIVGEGLRPSSTPTALTRLLTGSLFALGLTMIQLLPVWNARDFVSHQQASFDAATGQLAGQYGLGQSIANLTLAWESWQVLENPPLNLLAAVDYAYIGIVPFVLIAGLTMTGIGHNRKIALIALLLAVAMMIWGAGQTFVVNELYRRIPLLAEFRYLGRAHAVAALWWIVLAGIALDALWQYVAARWTGIRARIAHGTLLILAAAGIMDAAANNRQLLQIGPPENEFGSLYALTFGRDTAQSPFPIIQQPHSPSTYDAYASRVRLWGLDEGWQPLPVPGGIIPADAPKLIHLPGWAIVSTAFERGGTYALARQFVEQHGGEQIRCISQNPQAADPCDLEANRGSILYRIPGALPYAFAADAETLTTRADTLTPDTLQQADSVTHHMDTITISATTPADGRAYYLIVQETHFPGWQAQVDGEPIATVTISAQSPDGPITGFIGIPMRPGQHDYTLRYEPPGFTVGAVISLLTLIGIGVYLGWPKR